MMDIKGKQLHHGDSICKEIDGKLVTCRISTASSIKFPFIIQIIPEDADDDIGHGKGIPHRLVSPDELREWEYVWNLITPV